VISPLMPADCRRGRPRKWSWIAIFYVMRGSIEHRLRLVCDSINHALLIADRERVGREASPTGAVLASQSVKTAERGGPEVKRARRSKAASATPWSIPMDAPSTKPASGIATVQRRC
jgi:hypothetical protein